MELVKVFNDTRRKTWGVYKKDTTRLVFKNTEVYKGDLKPKQGKKKLTPIDIVKGGTVSVGYQLAKESDTAILNFADALIPGGRVILGSKAQEENICRCTNLYSSLISLSADKYYRLNRIMETIDPGTYTNAVIYSKDVVIFKDDVTYADIKKGYVDVITCPAPSVELDDMIAFEVYKRRIEQIVLSAIKNSVETIVLGAWGCGAFRQNPYVVASAFASVLNKYSGYFKAVVFAIRPTPKKKSESENSVLDIFYDVLSKEYRGEVTVDG